MSVTRSRHHRHGTGWTAGFSLLEVLITLVVVSIGLLGLAKLQLNAIKFVYSSHLRSQALFLSRDIFERMRANRTLALSGAYATAFDVTVGAVTDCVASACTPAQMVTYDLAQWKADLSQLLPSGDGEISAINAGGQEHLYVISVRWDDNRSNEVTDYKTFSLRTEL
ncbi:MAG: type IV pilus modification protein PilV [Magnetococcales bacterium]|nr:type IV pilus modification protein PilV [Magnetococcales bacterium]MBF0149579.1 type IV pilus modification protein PilV [Magnetococcales bacterium]MBF0348224.1 type IV pilus modification protein PilV [Magnetococcales bacterium]MBF0631048.1 type IV pilus modification protein PilV [Magnetococcales bacterium]